MVLLLLLQVLLGCLEFLPRDEHVAPVVRGGRGQRGHPALVGVTQDPALLRAQAHGCKREDTKRCEHRPRLLHSAPALTGIPAIRTELPQRCPNLVLGFTFCVQEGGKNKWSDASMANNKNNQCSSCKTVMQSLN